MANTANFGFMEGYGTHLAALPALAESYFRSDPSTALFKLRQFAEFLAKEIAARHVSYERALPRETADQSHGLRRLAAQGVSITDQLSDLESL